MVAPAWKGGEKLRAKLAEIADRVSDGNAVRVGFLEGGTYPDGTSIPMVAAVQEFGGTIEHPGGTKYITDAVVGKGKNQRLATRFVSNDFKGNTETTKAHTIEIPARPFMRPTIAAHKGEWGSDFGKVLTKEDYNVNTALTQMGNLIAGQIRQSIKDVTAPPLAPSTVARKGFDKPLIDTAVMWNSVDYEIPE